LAERANLNFIYGEGIIRGKVTLNLRDVPLGVALQGLLSSQDLAIVREGENVMRIAPRKEVRPGAVDTRTVYIKLNWVKADELIATLAGVVGTEGGGSLKSHAESNTIIITDSAPNVALLRDLVAQLDVPEKQVLIEARMAELLITKRRQLGSNIAVERRDSSNNSFTPGLTGSNLGEAVDGLVSTLGGAPGASSLSFGGVVSILGNKYDIAAVLDGLENNSMVNTLANPKVITLNNQEASIDINREVPYIEAQQGVTQGAIAGTVKFKDVGIKLTVLPTITNNGYVRMNLKPEQRILAGFFAAPGSTASGQGAIPIVNRRIAETNVIVKDEDTVVLGGLRSIDSNNLKNQMPWIGQAPILGWFFKNDFKDFQKNDLMLFVTPHIVKAPIMAPAETYKFSRIDAHWDLPDFFFDDTIDQRESRHRFELDHNPRDYYPQTLKLPPPVEDQGALEAGAAVEPGLLGEGDDSMAK
jgi:type IV pilus assembly protein PilQ